MAISSRVTQTEPNVSRKSSSCCASRQQPSDQDATNPAERTSCCSNSDKQAQTDTREQADCCTSNRCSVGQPQPLTEPAADREEPEQQSRFYIADMCCPAESGMIESALQPLATVSAINFNLMERIVSVQHSAGSGEDVAAAIAGVGFKPQALQAGDQAADGEADSSRHLGLHLRLGVAVLLSLAAEFLPLLLGSTATTAETLGSGFSVAAFGWQQALTLGLSLLALALCGLTTYRKGWQAIRQLDFNINALMSIAVTGALLIGHWPEAAMVMALFTWAEVLEDKTLDRARRSIRSLLSLAPQTALVQQADGSWRQQPVTEVLIGQRIRIRPGDAVPLDAEVLSGESTLNQAAVTGESLSVYKAAGDSIFAGTLNEDGVLEARVTADASHSTLARIRQAIEQAQAQKAPLQRYIDRFARIYTPLVMLIALLTAVVPPLLLGWGWIEAIYRALIILVVACPCALIISTPVTIISGLSVAARQGLLIKGGLYLEQGRKLTAVAFDKTGTLTTGQPSIEGMQLLGEQDPSDTTATATLLTRAAALASHSSHPVSRALVHYAESRQLDYHTLEVTDFAATTGTGIAAQVAGQPLQLGSLRLLTDAQHQQLSAHLADVEQGEQSVLVLLHNAEPVALFKVVDKARDNSAAVIRDLHSLGLKTLMLSGDNPARVQQMARQLGITEARGGLLPEQKLAAIAELQQQQHLAMVGDGINDGPALARAEIGIAMGAAGSDTALETADIALLNDNLEKLPWFIRLSRQTGRLLMQNLVLALGSKAVFLLLALTGYATLWMAVFADVGTSMLVILNGLRLLKFKGR